MSTSSPAKDPSFGQLAELLAAVDVRYLDLVDEVRRRAEARLGLPADGPDLIEDPTYTAAIQLSGLVHFLKVRATRLAAGGEQATKAAADVSTVYDAMAGVR